MIRCPNPDCLKSLDAEERRLFDLHGPLVCPSCRKWGCGSCMPSGRGCLCLECETSKSEVSRWLK
jgi:hypothetical protein